MNNFNNYGTGESNNNHPIQDVNFVILEDTTESDKSKFEESHTGKVRKKKKRKWSFKPSRNIGIALIVVLCIVTSTAFGFGGAMLANNLEPNSNHFGIRNNSSDELKLSTTGTTLEKATGGDLTIKEIVALNANSVVEIKTESVTTDSWMMQYVTQGAGSGVIISSDGYIVTNNHVIEGSNKISVTLKNGKSYEAKLTGRDDETDLAVIKINATGLTPVVYGNSNSLEVGDLAVVIGNPLGSLGGTVTAGIISALDRSITIEGKPMTLLQTDASINPGNSGGGLFNQNGELVGVVVAKSAGSDVEGLGFAIPVNKVKDIVQELADYGYVRGRIDTGLTFVDLTSMKNAIFYGVRNLGIYIKSVDTDLAKSSGLQSGDMIYYIGETRITTASELTSSFDDYKVGDTVDITVVRDNEMKQLKLVLGEKTTSEQ